MPSYDELRMLQSLPLEVKIRKTEERIKEWVDYYGLDGVYISFSGGKDSTVLMDIVRNRLHLNIPAVFVDVPTQYPELKQFAMTWDNLTIIKPKISFVEVCEKYGFPLISKEVSECISGARKYLTSIFADGTLDRQTDRPYRYWYDRVTGTGRYQKNPHTPNADNKAISTTSRGGDDRKYHRLRGIGEFTKFTNDAESRGKQSKAGDNVGDADKRQGATGKGEYP